MTLIGSLATKFADLQNLYYPLDYLYMYQNTSDLLNTLVPLSVEDLFAMFKTLEREN